VNALHQCYMQLILAIEMAPHFKLLLSQSPAVLPPSVLSNASELIEKLEAENKTTLAALDLRLEEAEKTEGETEISDALRAKAAYITKIGDKVRRPPAERPWDGECITDHDKFSSGRVSSSSQACIV
jgi:hypothetical protein